MTSQLPIDTHVNLSVRSYHLKILNPRGFLITYWEHIVEPLDYLFSAHYFSSRIVLELLMENLVHVSWLNKKSHIIWRKKKYPTQNVICPFSFYMKSFSLGCMLMNNNGSSFLRVCDQSVNELLLPVQDNICWKCFYVLKYFGTHANYMLCVWSYILLTFGILIRHGFFYHIGARDTTSSYRKWATTKWIWWLHILYRFKDILLLHVVQIITISRAHRGFEEYERDNLKVEVDERID